MSTVTRRVLVLTGPTSSGKTAVASTVSSLTENLAVVNADSKQVYTELPVLTSQDSSGFLYGYISVFDKCVPSVYSWMRDCSSCLEAIWLQGKLPLIVGGTPMYIHSLLHGISILPTLPDDLLLTLSEELERLGPSSFAGRFARQLSKELSYFPNDSYKLLRNVAYLVHTGKTVEELYEEAKVYRLSYESIDVISLIPTDRHFLYSLINKKFVEAVNSGAIEEVEAILQNQEKFDNQAVRTICGFREISSYLKSEITFDQMLETGQKSIRNYAKRQLTWFRNKFGQMKTFREARDAESYIIQEARLY